jgi:hypothetical protein
VCRREAAPKLLITLAYSANGISLDRRLIDFGKHLADTLHQRAAAPGFARFARPFGSADLAVILTRGNASIGGDRDRPP